MSHVFTWSQNSYQPGVTNGPSNNTPCVTLGTDFQGEDLSRIQPWHGKPGSAEDECEHVDHGNGSGTILVGFSSVSGISGVYAEARETTSQEQDNTLADRTPIKRISAADTIEGKDTDKGGELGSC